MPEFSRSEFFGYTMITLRKSAAESTERRGWSFHVIDPAGISLKKFTSPDACDSQTLAEAHAEVLVRQHSSMHGIEQIPLLSSPVWRAHHELTLD